MKAWSDNSIWQLHPDASVAAAAKLINTVLRVSREARANKQSISCMPEYQIQLRTLLSPSQDDDTGSRALPKRKCRIYGCRRIFNLASLLAIFDAFCMSGKQAIKISDSYFIVRKSALGASTRNNSLDNNLSADFEKINLQLNFYRDRVRNLWGGTTN